MSASGLVEDFFRHEYGRLVATLVRRVGLHDVEAAEDAAQTALTRALEAWSRAGPPPEPSAWVFRVAHNALTDRMRARTRRARLAARADAPEPVGPAEPPLPHEVGDALLRMLFVCCDDALPVESRLVLALKILCGFAVGEIAARLSTSEANVYKRLARGRRRLREAGISLDALGPEHTAARLPVVRDVLYVMFTEGHLSHRPDVAIRRELCHEAIRLTTLLATHPVGRAPETSALLALMHLHVARLPARDADGGLWLLDEQDRTLWDREAIAEGLRWLADSARGATFSRFHAEAGIAAAHCLAPSFAETPWADVVALYEASMAGGAGSPLHALNRALAVAELRGPEAGLATLDGVSPPPRIADAYAWSAALADLHRRCGHVDEARRLRAAALAAAPSPAVRQALARRLSEA